MISKGKRKKFRDKPGPMTLFPQQISYVDTQDWTPGFHSKKSVLNCLHHGMAFSVLHSVRSIDKGKPPHTNIIPTLHQAVWYSNQNLLSIPYDISDIATMHNMCLIAGWKTNTQVLVTNS